MIRNIIFDLGGVLIDLKRQNAVDALQQLGVADADKLLGLYSQEGPFLMLENGQMNTAEFYDRMREEISANCGRQVTDAELLSAFNAFLVDVPIERLQALRNLRKKGYRLFVLSNTNPIMYNTKIRDFFSQEGLKINDYFDGIITSFAEGKCKPDPELFQVPLTRYGLKPEETLMLDDGEANCEGARSVGMQAIHIEVPNNVLDVISKLP